MQEKRHCLLPPSLSRHSILLKYETKLLQVRSSHSFSFVNISCVVLFSYKLKWSQYRQFFKSENRCAMPLRDGTRTNITRVMSSPDNRLIVLLDVGMKRLELTIRRVPVIDSSSTSDPNYRYQEQ
jgi:hypothetical protein